MQIQSPLLADSKLNESALAERAKTPGSNFIRPG